MLTGGRVEILPKCLTGAGYITYPPLRCVHTSRSSKTRRALRPSPTPSALSPERRSSGSETTASRLHTGRRLSRRVSPRSMSSRKLRRLSGRTPNRGGRLDQALRTFRHDVRRDALLGPRGRRGLLALSAGRAWALPDHGPGARLTMRVRHFTRNGERPEGANPGLIRPPLQSVSRRRGVGLRRLQQARGNFGPHPGPVPLRAGNGRIHDRHQDQFVAINPHRSAPPPRSLS
jgi:hypothetical protein